MDPWELTGRAPQGWEVTASHPPGLLSVPGMRHSQERPPCFGESGCNGVPQDITPGPRHGSLQGNLYRSRTCRVSVFGNPVCKQFCGKCSTNQCGIGDAHLDHLCWDCEQRILLELGENNSDCGCGAKCSGCHRRVCHRNGWHSLHLCPVCDGHGSLPALPAPSGGREPEVTSEDPWRDW